MVFSRFHTGLIVRVLVLGLTIFLFVFLLLETGFYATATVMGLAILYQTLALIRSIDKTNQELARFLRSIAHSDFSQSFSGRGHDGSFDELNGAFTEVVDRFRKTRMEKEEHFRYLQTVIEHVGVGLLSFTTEGEVELLNNAAKRLLRVPHLKNIRELDTMSPTLVAALSRLRSGERSLIRVESQGEPLQLALYATEFRMRERQFKLVSLQNIRSELEEKEMEAWQNLIRVLTHEIMNSITPISSLASTVNGLLGTPNSNGGYESETMQDIRGAVHTIERRSEGLLHFVDAYRNLTRVARPTFSVFPVAELFARVQRLMQARTSLVPVCFTTSVESQALELTADPEQIEQVLINLLLNALQAVEGMSDARIELRAKTDNHGSVILEVSDNGPGIPEEVREKIFVPFFTTKKDGSGIGLSLSRQIMRMHRGSISVRSEPGRETVFTLRF